MDYLALKKNLQREKEILLDIPNRVADVDTCGIHL